MIRLKILHVVLRLCLMAMIAAQAEPVPEPEPVWEPDAEDVAYISRTIYGEARGCDEEQRQAVAWCILARVEDPRFPDTVEDVVTQPYQFQGYSAGNPIEPCEADARAVLIAHHDGEWGLDPVLLWFEGDGRINHYRDAWRHEEVTKQWP